MIDTTTLEPKIYVICLAAYNEGELYGAWVRASQEEEAIHADIKAMLASSPILNAKNWAIQDYEDFGDIHPWHFREYTSIERIVELVAFFKKHGDVGQSAFVYTAGDLYEAQKLVEEYYCGEFYGDEDYALYVAEELMQVPENMLIYIDRKKLARDLSCDYRFINSIGNDEGVHVFHY